MSKGQAPVKPAEGRRVSSRRFFLLALGGAATASVAAPAAAANTSMQDVLPEKKKKESFKEYVTRQLETLTQVTGAQGAIQLEISALREKLNEVILKMDRCDTLVGDYNDVAAVNKSLNEIKKVLGIP